ncbi:MAG: AAA family ATPase [Muribaculaceae bacterium]|nr:AAA family ATPase [Muribaculaceae bacterium]
MDNLIRTSQRLVKTVQMDTFRYLYNEVNWDDRLIMIKGARGVGKTTMLLQHISSAFGPIGKALYVSCDNLWFTDNRIIDLASYHYDHGGTHLYLDEIHRYTGNWQQELKNIYDSYPDYHVAFTGSSMIHLDSALADLSRRCLPYQLYGLSFREFLKFERIADIPSVNIKEILDSTHSKEWEIINLLPEKVLVLFRRYIGQGYYPFYSTGTKEEYYGRIERLLDTSINRDIPLVETVDYETLHKLRHLLYIMAKEVPFTLNVQSLSQKIQVSRNTIIKMFDLLDKGAITRNLYSGWRSPKSVAKPNKILFDNTDIMAALSSTNDTGTIRETFAASMLAPHYTIYEPPTGDFLVDEKYLFEVGGKNKTFRQIADLPDSFVVVDEEESCIGNRIPLWMLGFLY